MKKQTTKQLRANRSYTVTTNNLRIPGLDPHKEALRLLSIVDQHPASVLAVADYYAANRPTKLDMTWPELAARYCSRQDNTPAGLLGILLLHQKVRQPDGWMLLECQMLDGSRLGELTIVPYGPRQTLQQPPTGPISPRGLASDMSVVIGLLTASQLPS